MGKRMVQLIATKTGKDYAISLSKAAIFMVNFLTTITWRCDCEYHRHCWKEKADFEIMISM